MSATSWQAHQTGRNQEPLIQKTQLQRQTTLLADGKEIAGYTGCNAYSGSYEAGEGSFTISELSCTEAGCPGPGLFEQERVMKDIPIGAERFSVDELRLRIESAEGLALVFER